MRMGSLNAVVVSEAPDVKEVLLTKGDHFENRPDWVRFEKMFGGDKNNSLAFCDMSNLQVSSSIIVSSFHLKTIRLQDGASWVPTPFPLQVFL